MSARRVRVRELRRNLSQYLRRIERGERLEVTVHGRPVAVLAPLGEPTTPLDRLMASGRVLPPHGDLMDLLPPRGRPSTATSDALMDERVER